VGCGESHRWKKKQVGANTLGVVLHDVEKKGARYSQYYKGSYYKYGKYYDHSTDGKKKRRKSRTKAITEKE